MKISIPSLAVALALGCSGSDDGGQVFSSDPPLVIGGEERPAEVTIPRDYDPEQSYPLLMVLHGRGASGKVQTGYFQLFNFVDDKGYVLIYPDGTEDDNGSRFWNATEACCAPEGYESVDDVGYLTGLIEEAQRTYNINAKRVYLFGHSNGGFMSFRLACEASEMITAFVSLAGAATANADDCQPATLPVSGLVVHGTADATISYEGGEFEGATLYPGAVENTERIASAAGCDLQATTDEGAVDLVPMVDGAETDRTAYNTGCMPGVDAALWTVNDGSHIPFFSEDFADLATDWLLRHSR